jgi:hypothetical protein
MSGKILDGENQESMIVAQIILGMMVAPILILIVSFCRI